MQHVLSLERDQNLFIDRNVQIVDVINVVGRAELAILAGVTQPPFELPARDLDRDGHALGAGLRIFTSAQAFI